MSKQIQSAFLDQKHCSVGSEIMIGKLAKAICGVDLPVTVLQSAAGFYLGTEDGGVPVSRESAEYFVTRDRAEAALASGVFTQRMNP